MELHEKLSTANLTRDFQKQMQRYAQKDLDEINLAKRIKKQS